MSTESSTVGTTASSGCPVAGNTSANDLLDAVVRRDPESLRCPYPAYTALREESPVHWSPALGAYVISRYDDIVEVLRDPRTFSSQFQSGDSSVTGLAHQLLKDPTTPDRLRRQAERRLEINAKPALLNADPPVHIRQRKLVGQAFTPRRVAAMEPDLRTIAEQILTGLAEREEFDLVRDFAMPLPMTIIARVLGVPEGRLDDFKRWSDAFTQGVGAVDLAGDQVVDLFESVDEFYDYFTEEIARRRTEPRDDLLTDLVSARLDGQHPLTVNEMLQMLVVFLVGGNETTTNLITGMSYQLLKDPGLEDRVRQDPSLIPALAEETLRLESPVQGLFRTTTAEVEVGGVTIPSGSLVWLVYASGNRDSEVFAAPDVFDVDADRTRHLAFGRGEHLCLGSAIARLEARIGIELLLQHFPSLSLRHGEAPPMHPSFVLHGISSLPVRGGRP